MRLTVGDQRSAGVKPWLLALVFTVAVVAGCASTPAVRVQSKAKESTDFSRYRTFDFKDADETFNPTYFSTANQKLVRDAIVTELNQRDLQRAPSPDLQVSIYLRIAEKQHDKDSPAFDDGTMVYNLKKYYGFYYGYGKAWAGQDQIRYKEGTLVVDLVDSRRNELVWQGIATGVLYTNRTDTQIDQRVRDAVGQMFKDFPVPAQRK